MIGYGIAWHEGQLFGPVNQAIGVLHCGGAGHDEHHRLPDVAAQTAAGRARRSSAATGATQTCVRGHRDSLLALYLPLLAASLLLLWLFDKLLPRVSPAPRLAWLGITRQ